MTADKYPSIFSRQMEAIVYIRLIQHKSSPSRLLNKSIILSNLLSFHILSGSLPFSDKQFSPIWYYCITLVFARCALYFLNYLIHEHTNRSSIYLQNKIQIYTCCRGLEREVDREVKSIPFDRAHK